MKRSLTLGAAVLACALVASAQEVPKFEAYIGYTFVHFSPSSSNITLANGTTISPFSTFNANGGGIQLAWNFNKYLGLVFDSSAAHHGDLNILNAEDLSGTGLFGRGTAVNFVAGPRFSWRKWSRVTPFAEAMFGGVHYFNSAFVPLLTPTTPVSNGVVPVPADTVILGRDAGGTTNFAMLIGGGVDIRINKRISLRPIEADYYYTKIRNMQAFGDNSQNNFRYSAGVNFTFGAR
jgi:hypothetical protein